MKLLRVFNEENVLQDKLDMFEKRSSVRAVVIDKNNNVALLYSNKFKYHTIPGGGVEQGETVEQAVKRECKEEVGCVTEIISGVGEIIEVREKNELINNIHCYMVSVSGEKGKSVFTQDETEDQFVVIWVTLEEAIKHIESDSESGSLDYKYTKQRNIIFLNEAKELIKLTST